MDEDDKGGGVTERDKGGNRGLGVQLCGIRTAKGEEGSEDVVVRRGRTGRGYGGAEGV